MEVEEREYDGSGTSIQEVNRLINNLTTIENDEMVTPTKRQQENQKKIENKYITNYVL